MSESNIDIKVDPKVLILYACLLAHDFHHDFMHLGVGRVTDALHLAGNTVGGGKRKRLYSQESSMGDTPNKYRLTDGDDDEESYDKYYNDDDESLEKDSGFDMIVNDIYTSLSYDQQDDDELAELIKEGINSIKKIDETIMKFLRDNKKLVSRSKRVSHSKRVGNKTPKRSGIQSSIKKKVLSDRTNRSKAITSRYTSTKRALNFENPDELSMRTDDMPMTAVSTGALRKKRKKKVMRKIMKTVKKVIRKTIKRQLKSRKKKTGKKKKKRKKEFRKKKHATKKKKIHKRKHKISGGGRGGPIKSKLSALKPILSDLVSDIGRDLTERYIDGEKKVIVPPTEIYQPIVDGWDEAFDAYATILSRNTMGQQPITTMEQLNVAIIKLYNSGVIKLVVPYHRKPEIVIPGEDSKPKDIYESNKPPDKDGNPSATFEKTIATCLCMLVKSNFFEGKIFRYDHKNYIEVDYAWYFAMKMAQLKYKVSPKFKKDMSSSEYMEGMDDAVKDRMEEKYKLRGSNTFARYIELLKEKLQIPPFKRPQLSPDQKKIMKQFGKDISTSWASLIPKSDGNDAESVSIKKIKGFLEKGVSTDSQVDRVMTDYFENTSVEIKTYEGPPTNPKDALTSYTEWKRSGELCLEVMDNAAPLGKWSELFADVKRTNYLPRALDAAGSSKIDEEGTINNRDRKTTYNITDGKNYVRLTYVYDGNNIEMKIEISLDGKILVSEYKCVERDLVNKPFSVKEVIRELFTKVKNLSGMTTTNLTQLLETTTRMNYNSIKDIFYIQHILPIVMHKLSGDMGQEVCAAGGIVRDGKFTPITQVHNDIPAFLRGVLLSSKRHRDEMDLDKPPQAPVIFQTAHSGRYLDSRT